jgi:type I restriction enzyme S subunit
MAEALWRKMFVEDADPKWQEYSLLEIVDLVGGGTPKTDVLEYWDGSVSWLSARDITSNHKSFIVQTEKYITKLGLKNSSAKILPKYATIISARGTVGNYCILSSPMAFSQSNYGILPRNDGCYFFTYLLIAHTVDELKSAAYGSVFDTITTNTFRDLRISLPTKDSILSFEKEVRPYFESILNNTIQIRTLFRLRNTLLPKLMSGEVRVK